MENPALSDQRDGLRNIFIGGQFHYVTACHGNHGFIMLFVCICLISLAVGYDIYNVMFTL